MSEEFHAVCKTSDIDDGAMKLVEVDERLVIIFRVGDRYYCIDDVCTHDGGTLSDGRLEGCEIVCPRHGAHFDICTGKALSMPATQDTLSHQVKIDGDEIWVKLQM